MSDKVKVYYFDMPARGEQIRCLLRHAKVAFEDVRIPFDKWGTEKMSGKFEYGQLPGVEFNGKMLTQTPAVMHFLAAKYNYLPSDPSLTYEVMNVYNAAVDIFTAYAKYGFAKDPKEKEASKKEFFTKTAPFMFSKLEERLKKQKVKTVMVGEKLTYADFAFAGFAKGTFLSKNDLPDYEPIYKNCPLLKAYLTELVKIC